MVSAVLDHNYVPTEGMVVYDIPMADIYSDTEFNIRGMINPGDVIELAKNIANRGLLQPITVQPYDKEGYKYRIVQGHRRHAAFEKLGRETIPAIIKHGLTELDAVVMNFSENINRKDLNILEEAFGVGRLSKMNLDETAIAKLINKGKNWVKIRIELLKMPEAIQQDAAAGFLTQANILDLSEVKDVQEQIEFVKRIKDAKINQDSRLPVIKKKKVNPTALKVRSREEIFDMLDHIFNQVTETNIATRALAWAAGQISNLDFHRDMIKYYKEQNITYLAPPEIQELLDMIKGTEK